MLFEYNCKLLPHHLHCFLTCCIRSRRLTKCCDTTCCVEMISLALHHLTRSVIAWSTMFSLKSLNVWVVDCVKANKRVIVTFVYIPRQRGNMLSCITQLIWTYTLIVVTWPLWLAVHGEKRRRPSPGKWRTSIDYCFFIFYLIGWRFSCHSEGVHSFVIVVI